MSIEDKIRDYILENFLFTDDQSALSSTDSFLEKGLVDSTGILEIMTFIEDEYEFSVEDDEMIPENLDSVINIVKFIGKKTA